MFMIYKFLGTTAFKILAALLLITAIVGSLIHFSYNSGVDHQKSIYAAELKKANDVTVSKNETTQTASNAEAKIQIVYRDKIVTKFKYIDREITVYENNPASHVVLDNEFVRLHDSAASSPDDKVEVTGSASGTNDASAKVEPVTTGQAIDVIADNYKLYYECSTKLDGWIRFYSDVRKTVNE